MTEREAGPATPPDEPGIVDLHCHLLPALDDGPQDEAAALDLAWALVDDGVSVVAATPHRTARFAPPALELRTRHLAFTELLAREGVPLEVVLGSEVAVDAALDLTDDDLAALRLGASGALLVELPQRATIGDPTWPVLALLDRGVPVLLAHPERIPFLREDPAALVRLVDRGARTQLTSGALLGSYGEAAAETALRMLDDGLVDVLASDAHHATGRPPETSRALTWLAEHRPRVDGAALTVHTPRVLLGLSPTS